MTEDTAVVRPAWPARSRTARAWRRGLAALRRAGGAVAAGTVLVLMGAALPGPAAAQTRTDAVIEGRVVAAEDGRPLEGARVRVPGTARAALTDAAGRFRLRVEPGTVVVETEYIGHRLGSRSVEVGPGASVEIELRLDVRAVEAEGIIVTSTREAVRRAETPATVGVVAGETIRDVRPSHPSDVMNRVAGVWVNVTGGEGHMAAIRQPKTTSPVYLYLEDGVPTRSTGFFNHNALYEVNVPQADRIEVVKGPASALYGSDAIGGTVNVSTRAPGTGPALSGTVEGGAFGWGRLLASATATRGSDAVRLDVNATRTDGWRDGTAYDRQSGTVRWDRRLGAATTLRTVASYSRIDQQTAGSSAISRDDYLSNPTANYTPISFRKVQAFRLSSALEHITATTLYSATPFVRWNTMEMLPNWTLAFDPQVSESGHRSIGALLKVRRDLAPLRARVIAGADIEYSPGSRFERRITPLRDGPVFTAYTDGDATYDYDVAFQGVSPYVQAEAAPVGPLRVTAGLRYDRIAYDYENRLGELQTGPHRRPASTRVTYGHWSPKLGATLALHPAVNPFVAYGHGFRAPSEGQLFRQGQAVNTVGLKPVKADNVEAGVRGAVGRRFTYDVAVYALRKTDDILALTNPDGTRETVNAGETLHRGVEVAVGAELGAGVRVDAGWTRVRHTYEEWAPRADLSFSGNEMEDAPRSVGNVAVTWSPGAWQGAQLGLDWQHIGAYWMDAANTHRYDGHDLFSVRASLPVTSRATLFARVTNLTDTRYAEGAAYTVARGEEFAPGLPRVGVLGVEVRW